MEKKKETFQEYLKRNSFLEATKLYETKGGTVYLVTVKGAKEEGLYVGGGSHVLVFTDGTWRIFTEWKEYEQQLGNH